MTKAEKTVVIAELKAKFENNSFFYVTDASALTVGQVNDFRRKCFEKGVEMKVAKNSLIKKALEDAPASKGYADLLVALKGQSALLFSDTGNVPAKLIEEFRKTNEKPLIKAAYIDSAVFIGDDQLATLTKLKSKNDLIGEVIGLLQSPAKNVIGALTSGGQKIAGIVKALEERAA